MATLILASLIVGYVVVFLFWLVMGAGMHEQGTFLVALIGPVFFWPATLSIAGIAFLVFLAIAEHKR
jgi:hypothetical protein